MSVRFVIEWTLRLIVGLCFVWAASAKLLDPVAFLSAVESYQVVEAETARWVALILPWLELWAGIGLALPWLRWASGWILGLLLLGFMVLHSSAWWRGLDVDCGCFGTLDGGSTYAYLLVRNGMLLLGVAVLICMEMDGRGKKRVER